MQLISSFYWFTGIYSLTGSIIKQQKRRFPPYAYLYVKYPPMKRVILPFLFLLLTKIASAQIINFPDANFKNALLNHWPVIDTNNDGEIQLSEAAAVQGIDVMNKNIADLTGINSFVNLLNLNCSANQITSLDLSGLTKLDYLDCGENQISIISRNNFSRLKSFSCSNNPVTSIDLSSVPGLTDVTCERNPQLVSVNLSANPGLSSAFVFFNDNLSVLNVSGCTALGTLWCDYNDLEYLDLNGLVNLHTLFCGDNPIKELDLSTCKSISTLQTLDCPDLWYINLKNGQPGAVLPTTLNDPSLTYVCADEDDILALLNHFVNYLNLPNIVNVNTYCSFTPGGQYNTITGTIRLDNNANGCDNADMPLGNLKIKLTDATNTFYTTANSNGMYDLYTYAGNYTVTPEMQNPYFTVSPAAAIINFPANNGTVKTQDFCVTKNGVYKDVEITILPETSAKPGFDASYQLVYTNKGTETLSGDIELGFDDNRLTFLNAAPVEDNQQTGHLKWAYINLQPFETRSIEVNFNVKAPPINNINDTLVFNAVINPVTGDNSFALQQIVVGAFDPNDKSCLEGSSVHVSKIGDYVHYMIRFQNLGTDTAVNVVVKDLLKDKFDWSSFQMTKTSHPCIARQSKGNQLEFIFKNINLPAKIQNEAASNGFVAFKIRSKATLVAGDSLINDASIYFDYNLPVITNKAISKYVNSFAVNLGNDLNVCGNAVTLDAGYPGAQFLWNTGATTQRIVATSSGTYAVSVTINGQTASDTVQVTFKPIPIVNLGNDVIQCGGTVVFNAGNPGCTYLWSNAAVTQTITVSSGNSYFVKVTNTAGCSNTDTVLATIRPLPVLTLNLPDSVDITAPAFALTATPGGGIYSGIGVSNGLFEPSVAGAGNNTIGYTYTDAFGCIGSISKNIFVKDAVTPAFALRILPNINKGSFIVEADDVFLNTSMKIFNASGLELGSYMLTATQQRFDLTLPVGLYYLHFKNKDIRAVRKMVIVR